MFGERRVALMAFFALVVVWGSSFAAIKVGLDYTPPVLFAGLRTLFGGLIITLAAIVWAGRPEFGGGLPAVSVSALFNVCLFIGLQTFAVLYLPSGSAAVLIYLQPILVGFMAWMLLGEGLSATKLLGLGLGFSGVVAVSAGSLSGELSLLGVVCGVLAALSWAVGTVHFKRFGSQGSTLWFVAGSFLLGGGVLTALGLLMEPFSGIRWTGVFVASLLYTSVAGSGLAWVLWLGLVAAGEASRVAAYVFFVPLVSVVVGALFLGETLSYTLTLGTVLVVAGIYLVNRRSTPETGEES